MPEQKHRSQILLIDKYLFVLYHISKKCMDLHSGVVKNKCLIKNNVSQILLIDKHLLVLYHISKECVDLHSGVVKNKCLTKNNVS